MPVACGGTTSVLTGSDGAILFSPPGTEACLLDSTDFPAGDKITIPSDGDFRQGDAITFTAEGAANLDSALTAGTTYYIVTVDYDASPATMQVSAIKGGTPITLNNDGGVAGSPATTGPIATLDTGGLTPGAGYTDATYSAVALTGGTGSAATADIVVAGGVVTTVTLVAPGTGYTAGDSLSAAAADLGGSGAGFSIDVATINAAAAGNSDTPGTDINVSLAAEFAVCQVGTVDLSFTRGEVDITSLPCNLSGTGAAKLAGFRTYQAGYAEGSGSMTVRFTRDQTSIANRMIQGALFTNQTGAKLTIALEAVGDGAGGLDYTKSQVVSFPVSLLGFSTSLTPEDQPTEATVNFRLSAPPTELLGLSLN